MSTTWQRTTWQRRLALLQICLLLAGCVSMRTAGTRDHEDPELGGLQVTIFADDDDRAAGVVGPHYVVSELERRENGRWFPVFKAMQPSWSVADLPPGKYRLRIPAMLDSQGHAVALQGETRVFRVQDGEIRDVEVVLDHFPTGLVVAGIAVAVIAAILLHDWLDDHDLPVPPLPHPVVADLAFHLTVDLAAFPGYGPGRGDLPPAVTTHFPEDGALVAARSVRVVFAMSEPLNGGEIDPRAITVVADHAGLVPGTAHYDSQRWWLTWEGEGDLPRDDHFTVTLQPTAVEDLGGNELTEPVTFTFRTTH